MLNKFFTILIFLVTVLLFLPSCASVPKFTSGRHNNTKNVEKRVKAKSDNTDRYGNYNILDSVTGIASYYAHKYHGRKTSNGETYDMYGLTAAHPTYPHETIIRVTNLSNNKSVIIRVNDRMPQWPDRIIDLSYGTALELDMIEDGIVEVRLDILKWGEK